MARAQRLSLEVKAQEGHESWKKSRIVIKSDELIFRTSPGGTVALHVNANNGFTNRQIGGSFGVAQRQHRHNMEAIIHTGGLA